MQQLSASEIDQICLWYLLQHSISSFNKLMAHFGSAERAIQLSALATWQQFKLHIRHIERLQHFHTPQGQLEFQQCLTSIAACCDHILFRGHTHYPEALLPYEDSPPILFVAGQIDVLQQPQIAMVGSRQPSPHGAQIAFDFAHFFTDHQFVITSGLALGIDAAAHQGAIQQGKSIAVIGTGLDQCYPAVHQPLWQTIIQQGGAIISEFLPHTPPARHNFPRRNRIISGLSLGTLVVEAGLESGSLITAKEAANQGKQVFAIPGHIYSNFHQGCHQLIREGATLVDHPAQVIEDLSMFGQLPTPTFTQIQTTPRQTKSPQPKTTEHVAPASPDIPAHLHALYQCLDWSIGISLDELALQLPHSIAELNVAIVELELLGLCKQHAGRYLRS
jgi:DNA processing protein